MRYAEVDIELDADSCYRHLCDVESIPAWLDRVSEVRVLERDPSGRATVAEFIGGRGSAGILYTLSYDYDDAARCVSWRIREASLRDLDGEARISSLGDERCHLRYGLHASSLVLQGGSLRLEDEAPEAAAESFRRWVQSR